MAKISEYFGLKTVSNVGLFGVLLSFIAYCRQLDNEDVNLMETPEVWQAKHTLADIDQEGHTLPPTTSTRIISKIETVLSSPQIHGMSRNLAIISQFVCLEDRYIQMCDNQLTMTQNMGKQIDSLTDELRTAQKQLQSCNSSHK